MNHFEKQEAEHLPTTVTDEDLANAITDEHGAKYSPDGKRLLRGLDIGTYEIKAGTEVICDNAFWGCSSLRQINIPDSVTSIGYGAFRDCRSLEQINIPDSVTRIESGAFWGCTSLEQINIPDSVTRIEIFAFRGCSSLREINIPDSVTSIGNGAFSHCESLEEIYFPDSVTSIGILAFWGCDSLQTIIIPRGSREKFEKLLPNDKDKLVENIEHLPTTVTDEDLANAIADEYGVKYSPDGKCLLRGANIETYTIKEGTEVICDGAFEGCSSLEQINIPDSVTAIGNIAFSGCTSLQEITIPSSVRTIGTNPFAGCTCTITCHSPHFKVVGNVLYNSDLTKLISCLSTQSHFNIPDNVTSIGDWAFEDCKSLEIITIPSSVRTIGENPFVGCTCTITCHSPHFKVVDNVLYNSDLTKLISCLSTQSHFTIPDNVTSIGDSAFEGCSSLRQINIPNSVTSIKFDAFRDCSSLRQINIPAGSREKFEEMLPDERHMLVEAGD